MIDCVSLKIPRRGLVKLCVCVGKSESLCASRTSLVFIVNYHSEGKVNGECRHRMCLGRPMKGTKAASWGGAEP